MRSRVVAALIVIVLSLVVGISPAIADTGSLTVPQNAENAITKSSEFNLTSVDENRISIAKAKVSIKPQLFSGKAVNPKIKVTVGNKRLIEDRDYKTTFKKNVNPGTAKVIISGIGNYKNKLTTTFTIKTKKGLMKVANSAYFFKNTKGLKAVGWVKGGSKWYWGNSKGKLVTGWKKISGTWYYFDKSTYAMQTNWKKIDGKWYYFYKSGSMAASEWVGNYYLQSDGSMATNKWIGDYWVNGSGKWTKTRSSSSGGTVYITTSGNGTKYHRYGCRTLSRSSVRGVSVSEAISMGYSACKVCNP